VCHPSLGTLCGNDNLDRPLIGLEAKIGDGAHTAGAIGDMNLSAGLLLWHGTFGKGLRLCDV
jgi:hypothetical protein